MKKISVIVPVYNSEEYIEKCLDSILNQTYKDIEILVINDGSKDNSEKIIKEYVKKYPKQIVFINQENMGVAKTRNNAIKKATGDYIAFIDNDDYIDKDYFETLINKIEDNDIVISGYRRPNSVGKIVKELKIIDNEWSKFLVVAPWAKLYKKSFIEKNKLEFLDNNIGEDVYFNVQAFLVTDKIAVLDYIGYNWFFNEKSVSNTKQRSFKDINVDNLLNTLLDKLKEKDLIESNKELLELYFYRYVLWFLLFASKKQKYKDIKENYEKLFKWLDTNFPGYKKNKMIGLNKPKGDTKFSQLLYWSFRIIHKMKLGKLTIFIYSKI